MTNYFTLHFTWIIAFLLIWALQHCHLPPSPVPLHWILFSSAPSHSHSSALACTLSCQVAAWCLWNSLRPVIHLILRRACLGLFQRPVPCHASHQQLLSFFRPEQRVRKWRTIFPSQFTLPNGCFTRYTYLTPLINSVAESAVKTGEDAKKADALPWWVQHFSQ